MRKRFKWRLAVLVYLIAFSIGSNLNYVKVHAAAGMVLLVLLALPLWDETILTAQTNQ